MDFETANDALLYAIEVSATTLDTKDGPSIVHRALDAAHECIRVSMLATPNNSIGVMFYGANGHTKSCWPFMPLGKQNSESVKRLMRMVESETHLASLLDPGEYNMGDILFAMGQEFEKIDSKLSRRVVLVTANDNPLPDSRLAQVARTKCRDLVEKNVTILPIFVGKSFNLQIFWDSLTYAPSYAAQPTIESCKVEAVSLAANVQADSAPKRSLFSAKIYLKNTAISNVKGYNLYSPRKLAQPVQIHIDGEKQSIVETKTHYIVSASGKEVKKEDCRLAFKLGTHLLDPINPELVDEMRKFDVPSIRVLKVIDKDACRFIGNMKHSTFIYPYEGDLQGSTRAFIALWKALLNKNQYAIAHATLRQNSTPSHCLLVPSRAVYYSDQPNIQRYPSGLHIVHLPTSDSVRKLADLTFPLQSAEHVEVAGETEKAKQLRKLADELVENLTMKRGYQPLRYPNPAIVWQDEVIEATALSLPMPSGVVDSTIPKYKSIQQRGGQQIAKMNALVDGINDAKRAKQEQN